jgi:peptidoglycan hydrolase CwlO-like protein
MPLTIDELTSLVEALQKALVETQNKLVETQKKVEKLDAQVKQYQQEIIGFEIKLSESITTQKLFVKGDAQVSGRNILEDRQILDAHEFRLDSHLKTLNTHQDKLTSHEGKLDSHDSTLITHKGKLDLHEKRTQKITSDGTNTNIDAGATNFVIQGDGNLVVYRKSDGVPLWNSRTTGGNNVIERYEQMINNVNARLEQMINNVNARLEQMIRER